MLNEQLHKKLESLPSDVLIEVEDFVDFLLSKKVKGDSIIQPKFGSMKGEIVIHDNFDEPLEEFSEYMN